MSSNPWSIAVLFYGAVVFMYHCREQIVPYSGERRWMACCDLFSLTLLEYSGAISAPLSMALKGIQVVWISIQSPRSGKRTNAWFFSAYFSLVFLSFFVSGTGNRVTSGLYAFGQTIGLSMVCLMILWDKAVTSRESEVSLEERESKTRRQLISFQKEAELDRQHQRVLFKCQGHYCKTLQKIMENPRAIEPEKRGRLSETLQEQLHLLSLMESLLVKKSDRIRHFSSAMKIEKALYKHFERAMLMASLLAPEICGEGPSSLQIHPMGDVPKELEFPALALWEWTWARWFDYFFSPGKCDGALKIWISATAQVLSLKGIARLKIQEISAPEEGLSCPICQGRVRALCQPLQSTLGSCRECLKKKTENELKKDWDPFEGARPEFNPSLWLTRHIVQRFSLGNIHYGIENWTCWEYFVTLDMKF